MGSDSTLISSLLAKLSTAFNIRDLGAPSFFFGIETVCMSDGLLLSQRCYMGDIFSHAGMIDYKPLATPIHVSRHSEASLEPFANPTQYLNLPGTF